MGPNYFGALHIGQRPHRFQLSSQPSLCPVHLVLRRRERTVTGLQSQGSKPYPLPPSAPTGMSPWGRQLDSLSQNHFFMRVLPSRFHPNRFLVETETCLRVPICGRRTRFEVGPSALILALAFSVIGRGGQRGIILGSLHASEVAHSVYWRLCARGGSMKAGR